MNNTRRGYKRVKSLYGGYSEIPKEWEHAFLSDFVIINMGQSPPSNTYNEHKNGLPFFQGVSEFGYRYPKHKFWCSEPKKIAEKNQILFSVRAPVGKINISNTKCCIGRGLATITPKNSKLAYCYYALLHFKNHFLQYSQGTTYNAIDKESFKEIIIPYTKNNKEQQKIASILSGVDAAIEATQRVIEETEMLKKGLMQELLTRGIGHTEFKKVKWLFGKEVEIPEKWNLRTLDSLNVKSTSGGTPSREKSRYYNGNIIWIKSGELENNFINSSEEKITAEALRNSSAKVFPKNTVLVAIYGATIGKTAILAKEGSTNQAICAILPNDIFHEYFLQQFLVKNRNILVTFGMGAGQPNISQEIIRNFKYLIPPLSEQTKIALILSGIDAYIWKNQEYKKKLERLKKGVLQKLLTGQIRVKVDH